MDILRQVIPLLFPVSLAMLVFAVGLDATGDDLLFMLRRPKLLLRAFLAISVVVPLVGIAAALILPLQPVAKAGLVLMAIAPVPPLVPGKDLKIGGRKEYVYGLYLAFALLSIILVPLSVAIIGYAFGKDISIPAAVVARTVLTSVFAPLLVGLLVGFWWPRAAKKLSVWVSKFSMLLLVIGCVPMFIKAWPAMQGVVGDGTVVAICITVAAALAAGHLLGGPEHCDRLALAGAAATRHPGIAIMVANANVQDKRVNAVILLFLVVSIVVVAIYQQWLKRSGKLHPLPTARTTTARM